MEGLQDKIRQDLYVACWNGIRVGTVMGVHDYLWQSMTLHVDLEVITQIETIIDNAAYLEVTGEERI